MVGKPDYAASPILDPVTLSRIENLSMRARVAVDGFLSGLHRSRAHGFGSEFLQYRNYTPGEDLKFLDWKVLAKSERLYTKVFEEETNMTVYLLVDLSASMGYQGPGVPMSKDTYAATLAACLAYLAYRQGDRVGLYLYSDQLRMVIEPGRRPDQLARIFRTLQSDKPQGSSGHGNAMRFLENHIKSRGLVVLISDMLEAEASLPPLLSRINTAHNDILALQVLDPTELTLPEDPALRFIDLESGADVVTSPEQISQAYQERFRQFQATLRNNLRSARIELQVSLSSQPVGEALARFLSHHARFR